MNAIENSVLLFIFCFIIIKEFYICFRMSGKIILHCLPQLRCSQLVHNPAGGCYGALFATTVLFTAGTQSCRWCYGALFATTVLFTAGTQSCRWCYGALFATTVLFTAGKQSCRWLLWCIVCHNCAVHSWYTILQVAVMVHCLP